MKELIHKLKEKSVGADASVRPFFREISKENKGITLIALIITIIVMLILVGVTVSYTVGENGILSQAKQAKVQQDKATEQEELIIEAYATYGKDAKFNKAKFKVAIEEKDYTFDEATGKITTPKGNIFYVNDEGEITQEQPIIAWDGETKTEVEESENNIYYISNSSELAWLAEEVNSGNTFSGKTIELTKDIDLGDKEWTPIGRVKTQTDMTLFQGTFDGNCHIISNIKITEDPVASDVALGLFEGIANATIKNLGVENGTVIGKSNSCTTMGGIVGGTMGNCNIINCYNKNVNFDYTDNDQYGSAGGIAGVCFTGELTIECCYNNSGTIYDHTNGSGIIGTIMEGTSCIISNSYNAGIVANDSGVDTGIYARNGGTINLSNCYSVELAKGDPSEEVTGITVIKGTEQQKTQIKNSMIDYFCNQLESTPFVEDKNNINNGYPVFSWQ